MKKSLMLFTICSLAFLPACSSVYNRGIRGVNTTSTAIEVRPMEASIQVGNKMRGTATCRSFFGFSLEAPEKEAYGATLDTNSGNVAPQSCTRGAIYNALSRSNADLIIAPQYEVDAYNSFCFPFTNWCLYKRAKVSVTGYEGMYTNIKELDPEIIKHRQLSQSSPAQSSSVQSIFQTFLP